MPSPCRWISGISFGTAIFAVIFVGAVVGDFLDNPVAAGGLALSRYSASLALLAFIVACISSFRNGQRARRTDPCACIEPIVPSQDVLQSRVVDRHQPVTVDAGHRARGNQRIDDRLFGREHGRLEQAVELVVRQERGLLQSFDRSRGRALAVEKAMKMSPEPLPAMLPVRARPIVARRARRLS